MKKIGFIEPDSGFVRVNTQRFGCTFFHGHMFPVYFVSGSGKAFPGVSWRDELTDETGVWRLQDDRWAEFNLLDNSPERFVMECTGTFCRNDLRPFSRGLSGVSACFRYTIEAGNPVIRVEAKLTNSVPRQLEHSALFPVTAGGVTRDFIGPPPGKVWNTNQLNFTALIRMKEHRK
ncbi:MAG: hypothetical protein BWY31_00302 [Lentisphaerae bacterium ADurb.Bin242]|nr:MAG: hypothetical protein BWY31_00302 [Lentisphaerae bacterium ADurb.Bin242]